MGEKKITLEPGMTVDPNPEPGELVKEIHMNTVDFEKGFVAMQQITEPLRLGKKMRVIVDYDPHEEKVKFQYFIIGE